MRGHCQILLLVLKLAEFFTHSQSPQITDCVPSTLSIGFVFIHIYLSDNKSNTISRGNSLTILCVTPTPTYDYHNYTSAMLW